MKHYTKLFFAAAVAALGLASCAKEVAPVETPKDNLVTVHFGATAGIEGATKATLTTEDELTFTSAWENGDELSVKYTNDNETVGATTSGIVSASWSTDHFETTMPEYTGMWDYNVVYPAPNTESKVDFGSTRTQKGNAYNSKYDLMKGGAIEVDADAGKTADGKNIVFEMTRQTAIAYFHLTSTLDEEVVSAKLSVEGNGAYLSTSDVQIGKDNSGNIDYAKGYTFTKTEGVASKEINLTFDAGTAPMSSDFKLWFNVLPTKYTKMTLTVETANHTLTISRTAPNIDEYVAGKLYKVVKKEIPAEKWVKKGGGETPVVESWIATDLADITATDEVVITMAKGESVYAMTSDKGTKDNPQAVLVTVKDGELSATPADNLIWNIANDKGNLTIYPNGQTDKWLYSVSKETAVKVGNSTTNKIFTLDATKYLKNTGTKRYLGVSNSTDWRCYSSTSDIAGQTLCFYVKGTPKTALETPANLAVSEAKVVSWDAVSGAASYNVTIGTETFTSNTNSYDAAAIADDYYDVAVVAVPSDKENYKNSAAATLSGVKFGTPTLTTPELTEGAIDEISIRVNMAVDARATNGCTCEIYKGETLVESKTIKVKYVVFSGLESGVTYTIKVNAIAVEGEKPYAASDVASIELKTKPAQHVSDVTAAGTYTIKGLTVYAVANTSVAIAGDNTGYILVYKRSHGLNVGNTFDAAGNAELYNGVWELNSPSITNIKNGEIPIYPNAVEATEDYLNAYSSSQKIQYVHIKGIQRGKYIEVGGTKVFMETPHTEMEGKGVDAYGFIYGYHTTYNNAFFVVTSIKEDQTTPTLSVDQTSKTWAADATDAFVVNVAVNSEGGDWTVTPETLPWATIAVDKAAGTITITPNGANETETANEATLTVTHASDASLTAKISLKQNGKGEVLPISFSITGTAVTSGTVTFEAAKGKGATTPAVNSGLLRLYAKNTITIEDSAKNISKIEIVFAKQGKKDYITTLTADSGTVVSGGASESNDKPVTDTWTSSTTPTKKVVFTLGDSGQRVIKSVKVYF